MEVWRFDAFEGDIDAKLHLSKDRKYTAEFNFYLESRNFEVNYCLEYKTIPEIFKKVKSVKKDIESMLECDLANTGNVSKCIDHLEMQVKEISVQNLR